MTAIQYFHIAFETWGALFCLIAALCVYATRSFEPKAAYSLIGILLSDAAINLAESLAYYYRGMETQLGYVMVRVTNYVVFFGGYVLASFSVAHIGRLIEIRGGHEAKWTENLSYLIAIIGIILLTASRIFGFYYAFDEHNRYYRLDSYWISMALVELMMFLLFFRIMKNRKVIRKLEMVATLGMVFLPIIGVVIQVMFYGISIYNIADTLAIIFLVVVHELEYSADTVAREKVAAEERVRLYHSQIQPHFIYNCLTTIRSYIPRDSKAREVLNEFTKFLRGSLDIINEAECISASREFATVESYLYLEKERMGDNLTIEKEIIDTDFMIPPFTVQILVENAIKHGIRGDTIGKGTVVIKCDTRGEYHVIEVRDDGVGFDISRLDDIISGDEPHTHVGVINLRERLKLMCNGRLDIMSSPGSGTVAKVFIPLK